jgi:hypothetical protein
LIGPSQHPSVPTIHADTSEYAIATIGGVVVQLYRTATPVDAARLATQVAEQVVTAGLEPRGLFIVVRERAKPPEGEARQLLTRLGTRMSGAAGCAFVARGEGFGSAIMRSVMAGMTLLARPDFPVRIFAEPDAALMWFGGLLDVAWPTEPLRQLLDQLDA